ALMYAILAPPGAVLVFVAIMAFESGYTRFTRVAFFRTGEATTEVAALEPPTFGFGAAIAPLDQLKKEAEKDGPDVAKAEVPPKGDNVALAGGVAATGETAKAAPTSGNAAGAAAAAGEAGKTTPTSGNAAAAATDPNDTGFAAKALEAKFYTLKPGDTLWKIAETEYGHGHGVEYHLIFEANKSLLSDPRKVFPGQVLRIPPLSG
ncbi:MAG: LysM peptidoglycan-binding domain-containing protein, partial [Methylocella sp.]